MAALDYYFKDHKSSRVRFYYKLLNYYHSDNNIYLHNINQRVGLNWDWKMCDL